MRTRLIDKPLLALALRSLGFVADDERWPVFVGVGANGTTTVCPAPPITIARLRPHLAATFLKSQGITLTDEPPEGSLGLPVHLRSAFRHPDLAALRACLEERLRFDAYSARLLSFVATLDGSPLQV